jgi:Beta protein
LISEYENFIPSVQLSAPAELATQVSRFSALGRGCVVRLQEPLFGFSSQIAELFTDVEDQSTVHFILDYEKQSRDVLTRAAGAIGILNGIRDVLPNCYLSVSASTFPETFVDLARQEIFERQFHEEIFQHVGHQNVIYSDRASVRAESLAGGSGAPAPRIDNALRTNWQFFRVADNEDRDAGYQEAAENAVDSEDWADLGIWGTDEIIRTANSEATITSAARSTAVRINIHLHRQTNFDDPGIIPGTEEIWSD